MVGVVRAASAAIVPKLVSAKLAMVWATVFCGSDHIGPAHSASSATKAALSPSEKVDSAVSWMSIDAAAVAVVGAIEATTSEAVSMVQPLSQYVISSSKSGMSWVLREVKPGKNSSKVASGGMSAGLVGPTVMSA